MAKYKNSISNDEQLFLHFVKYLKQQLIFPVGRRANHVSLNPVQLTLQLRRWNIFFSWKLDLCIRK